MRLKGETYVGFRNVQHPARPLLPSPCSNKSIHHCSALVSEEQRKNIYEDFRGLPNINDQRNFIAHHVKSIPKKRTTKEENSRWSNTNIYFLTAENFSLLH